MKRPIYLDYMATTPVDPAVIAKMAQCLGVEGVFGNPASKTHSYGFEAQELVELARQQVATAIGADPREIVWTSGATEANNLALLGAAHFYQRQGRHIITMTTEHKAVLDPCRFLEREGFEVTYLNPEPNGILDLSKLMAAIRPDTILISIMHVNNETGVIQDIPTIGTIAQEHGIKFHVDAVQGMGKVPVDVNQFKADLASFSGHKVYGPKGIGFLYLRRQPRVRLQPIIYGGGHEQGMRSGTLPTHQIVGIGAAFELATKLYDEDVSRITLLSQRLWEGLKKLEGVTLNGDPVQRIPHCLNVTFAGIDGEALIVSLRDIAVSMGSACNSAKPEPSHVLTAYGLTREEAHSSLRISLGRFTTVEEVDRALQQFTEEVEKLRKLSPVWDKVQKNLSRRQ